MIRKLWFYIFFTVAVQVYFVVLHKKIRNDHNDNDNKDKLKSDGTIVQSDMVGGKELGKDFSASSGLFSKFFAHISSKYQLVSKMDQSLKNCNILKKSQISSLKC